MKAKYSCGPKIIPDVVIRSRVSHTWRPIAGVWDILLDNLTWVIQNDQDVRFWQDVWIPGAGRLCEHEGVHVPQSELEFTVSNYALNGTWDWTRLDRLLPPCIWDRLAIIRPPFGWTQRFSLLESGE